MIVDFGFSIVKACQSQSCRQAATASQGSSEKCREAKDRKIARPWGLASSREILSWFRLLSIDALLKLGQRAEQPTKEDAHGPETQSESQHKMHKVHMQS